MSTVPEPREPREVAAVSPLRVACDALEAIKPKLNPLDREQGDGGYNAMWRALAVLGALDRAGFRVVRQREAAVIFGDWCLLEFRDRSTRDLQGSDTRVWIDE